VAPAAQTSQGGRSFDQFPRAKRGSDLTRRQIARRAHDAEHKRLMLAYRNARGGEKLKALGRLKDYVTGRLNAGK